MTLQRTLITGANGRLGLRLLGRLQGLRPVRAVVRSERARDAVVAAFPATDVRAIDYADSSALTAVARGCGAAVHLVGIIRESRGSSYAAAHEAPVGALLAAAAAAGVERIVYLSILGADPASANGCLASRGRCEQTLLASSIPCVILKTPMVLGEGDYATQALARNARSAFCWQFRAASREQPIDANDLVEALSAAIDMPLSATPQLQLAGPESLTRRALIVRAGRQIGAHPRVISLPIALGRALARACEWLPSPPLTRDLLGVLDHDDAIDPQPAATRLGIRLTPLDATLARVLR